MKRFAYQDSPDTMGMAVDADDYDALLALARRLREALVGLAGNDSLYVLRDSAWLEE